jgi:hypothetical protein
LRLDSLGLHNAARGQRRRFDRIKHSISLLNTQNAFALRMDRPIVRTRPKQPISVLVLFDGQGYQAITLAAIKTIPLPTVETCSSSCTGYIILCTKHDVITSLHQRETKTFLLTCTRLKPPRSSADGRTSSHGPAFASSSTAISVNASKASSWE